MDKTEDQFHVSKSSANAESPNFDSAQASLSPPAFQLKSRLEENKEGDAEAEAKENSLPQFDTNKSSNTVDAGSINSASFAVTANLGVNQLKKAPEGSETELETELETKPEKAYQLAAEGLNPPSDGNDSGAGGENNGQPNNTGLPDQLKSGVESLSGFSMNDVKVHYNSDKPAQLKAHAYAQGTDIHLASGQEKHLPHEAWHVVQQKQGRVQPTTQLKAFNINDDKGLEKEADVMGARALSNALPKNSNLNIKGSSLNSAFSGAIQRMVDLDAIYAADTFDFVDKDIWIAKFKQVQDILNNQAIVDTHLQHLSDLMIQEKLTLSEVLKKYEGRTFSKEDTVLTDFVPPDVFLSLLREGRLFEDLVGKTHGVQTHRIQWSVVKSVLGCAETELIFKETGNPRWQLPSTKTIWDKIVDGINTEALTEQDFTIPDKLETYIYDKYQHFTFFNKKRNDPLAMDLHDTHDEVDDRKVNIKKRYPDPSLYPEEWAAIEQEHRAQKAELPYKQYSAYVVTHNHAYMNEKITNTSTVDGITKTIEWTGWILNESSQQPVADGPFFVPTVGRIINDED